MIEPIPEIEQPDHSSPATEPAPVGYQSRTKQIAISAAVLVVIGVLGIGVVRAHGTEQTPAESVKDPNLIAVSEAARKMADIQTEPVTAQSWQSHIRTSGLLSFPADRTVKVAPKLTGKIRSVLVKVGDRVEAGQPIAVMESTDAATAESSALQNDAQLHQAELDLARYQRLQRLGTPDVTAAQAALQQAEEGVSLARHVLDLAKYQDRIGGFTEKPLEDARNAVVAAVASLSQARSDYNLAQKDLNRKKQLVSIGVAAQADLEVSQDTFEKAEANLKQNQESLGLAQEAVTREEKAYKSRLYADQQLEQASSAYRQAVLQRNAASTALTMAKAQIERDLDAAQTAYRTATYNASNSRHALDLLGHPAEDGTLIIRAPVSGIVTERDVAPGQAVDQSQMAPWQLMVISSNDVVWVDADVYEKDISSVAVGQTVGISVSAVPGRSFEGRVLHIAPTLDKTSRAVKVRAEIPNPTGQLRDGEYADVAITVDAPHRALTIPWAGIGHEGDYDYAYVETGGKYVKRKISVGERDGDRCEVLAGLKEGEKVVTHGALYLGGQSSGD
jgi:RND family efflux transporter MFP subunit